MYYFRKMTIILLTISFMVSLITLSADSSVLSNATATPYVLLEDFIIEGQTMPVSTSEDFAARGDNLYALDLTLSTDLSVSSDGSLAFSFSLTHEYSTDSENAQGQIERDVITAEGVLYHSLPSVSASSFIALFDDTNEYRILNFQLERSASPTSIISRDLANLPVIKIVIFNDQTSELYYFEEALPVDFNFDTLDVVAREAIDKYVIERLTASYLWFWNFAERIEKPLNYLKHHGDIHNNAIITSTGLTSPIPGMNPNDFMTVGFYYLPPQRLCPNSSWGYLRESVRTPSGGISTFAIRYVYDHGTPIANPGEVRGGFRLTHNMKVTWHPDVNPSHFVVGGISLWRLENVVVSLGLGTANSEIIVETKRSASGGGILSIDTASMIGGLANLTAIEASKGTFFVNDLHLTGELVGLNGSVKWSRPARIDSNGRSTYTGDASGQFTTYGQIIRADSVRVGNNGYLSSDKTGSNVHQITLVSQLRRTGVTNYVTGSKTASWGFYFSVIEKHRWGYWSRNRWNHYQIIDVPYSGNFPG